MRALFQPRRVLVWLLALFCVGALAFNALAPLGEAPDELSHFAVVRFLASAHRLPTPNDGVGGEIFQPPLFYLLAAPLTAWQPASPVPVVANPDWELGHPWRGRRVLLQPPAARWPWQGEALAWHLARLPSTLYGVVTIVATYGLARRTFPEFPWLAVGTAACVAFLPQFVFLSGVLNNDTLATALGALLLWQLARLLSGEAGWRGWALVGLLGGLGVWTKSSGWVFVGTTIVAALLASERGGWRERLQGAWGRLFPAGLAWAVVGLPWLGLNWWRWGDPLGWGLMRQVTDARTAPLTLTGWAEIVWGTLRSFWAAFGGAAHLHFPTPLSVTLSLLLLLGLAGAWPLARAHGGRHQRLLLLWGVHLLLVVLALGQWARTVLGTGQGRLLFPALPAIAVLAVGGWGWWVARLSRIGDRQGVLGRSILGGMGVVLLASWALVWAPAYRSAQPLHPTAERVGWGIGDGLTLQAMAFPWTVDSRIPPGDTVDLYTEWSATQPLPDLRVRLQWLNPDGAPIWIKEGTPTAGESTSDQLAVGASGVAGWHRVEIPAGTAPGYYRLLLAVVPAQGGPALPLRAPDGTPLGDQVMVGQVTVVEGP